MPLHLLIRTGVPGGRSSHCQCLPQDELLPPRPRPSPAGGQRLSGRWQRRRRGRSHPHVPLVQQRPTRPARRCPHADNIRADIRPLQSAVSCPQNVAVLVSSPFLHPPPIITIQCESESQSLSLSLTAGHSSAHTD